MDKHGPTVGVGAIVVRDDSLLMVKRARDPGKDLWTLPGGRVEYGEYLGDAVAREVKEETDLDIEVTGFAGLFEVIGENQHFVILDFTAEATGDDAPVAGTDAAEARWVDFDEVAELDLTPRLLETLRGWGVL